MEYRFEIDRYESKIKIGEKYLSKTWTEEDPYNSSG